MVVEFEEFEELVEVCYPLYIVFGARLVVLSFRYLKNISTPFLIANP
ncbi:MAG: hypothetical protein QXQ48_06770 [Nitrososphaerota archaeon]